MVLSFIWETKVTDIDFEYKSGYMYMLLDLNLLIMDSDTLFYDKLIFGVGKSGIDFTSEIMKKYDLPTEEKPAQVGVRFEAPQKHFQKLIDIAYDFKLYRKIG